MYKSFVFKFLTESEVSSVPVGYQFTTDKGTEFYKSSTGWKNSLSDKSVAPKMAERLESAALTDIDTINASSEFKIGKSYTAADGSIYYYTGDDFVTVDGQSLPPDEADDAMKAVRVSTTDTNQEANVAQDEPVKNSDTKEEPTPVAADQESGDKSDEPEKEPVAPAPVDAPKKSEPAPVNAPKKSEPAPVAPTSKPAPVQQKKQQTTPTDAPQSDDAINKLAKLIKRHPRMLRLRKLIINGDPLSLLAADIILSGKDEKLKAEILTRLGEKK